MYVPLTYAPHILAPCPRTTGLFRPDGCVAGLLYIPSKNSLAFTARRAASFGLLQRPNFSLKAMSSSPPIEMLPPRRVHSHLLVSLETPRQPRWCGGRFPTLSEVRVYARERYALSTRELWAPRSAHEDAGSGPKQLSMRTGRPHCSRRRCCPNRT